MKKPIPFDFSTQLSTVPVRNAKLDIVESDTDPGVLLVEVQLRYRGLMRLVSVWVNARKRKRYALAGVSRECFEMLDGKRTVGDLIQWLCEGDNFNFFEGRALVLQYLQDLMKRGLIVIVPDVVEHGGRSIEA